MLGYSTIYEEEMLLHHAKATGELIGRGPIDTLLSNISIEFSEAIGNSYTIPS